ncbi:MAG: hypothetical protein ACRDJN_30970 [Chloroflexota bacterium]
MSYELWDIETGNLVGGYDTEEAALEVVRRSITEYGRESIDALGLARESRGRTKSIAVGVVLADRALAGVAAEAPAKPAPKRTPVPA